MYGFIKKNTYQDSVNLMLISSKLSAMDGVKQVSIMMGTPANKEIYQNTGMYLPLLDDAGPNDICIIVDAEDESLAQEIRHQLDEMIASLAKSSGQHKIPVSRTLQGALKSLPEANLALYSIPGEYVAQEVHKALDLGLNVMIFSDNVSITDEKALKDKAAEKGLLVMGPDCGTAIIEGVPLAFANVVGKGNIGIVGASGTGIQEVSTLIGREGLGLSHAIGLGGRDLSEEIGGISALAALDMLEQDPSTDLIVFISKPPAKAVMDKIVSRFAAMSKQVVAIFLGTRPQENLKNVHFCWTLEDAAYEAVRRMKSITKQKELLEENREVLNVIRKNSKQRSIVGIYCGGTLAGEAAMLLTENYPDSTQQAPDDGYMFRYAGHEIIDFGDDRYTKGHPHPMIDPSTRIQAIRALATRDDVAIVLLDNVLGYGSTDDMAGAIAPAIKALSEEKKAQGQPLIFIASVTGTEEDPQVYSQQVETLQQAGVLVQSTNAQAVYTALAMSRYLQQENVLAVDNQENLINKPLQVLNIGLEKFAAPIKEHGGEVVQYTWAPIAGGDKHLQDLLSRLSNK